MTDKEMGLCGKTVKGRCTKWKGHVTACRDHSEYDSGYAAGRASMQPEIGAARQRAREDATVDAGSIEIQQDTIMALKAEVAAAQRTQMELDMSHCQTVYQRHKKSGSYPIDMGGLAKECADEIQAAFEMKVAEDDHEL